MITIPNVTVTRELPPGDLCDLYGGTYQGAAVVVKVARNRADNDLVETEARMLRRLYPLGAGGSFYRYLCRCQTNGMVEGRAYNVIEQALEQDPNAAPPEYCSLANIIQQYPAGIDYRDAAWMFKRALVILGWTHQKNVVHGNCTPPHILVHPLGHGGKLVDWSYAVLLKDDPKKVKKKPERPTAWTRLMDDEDETHVILEDEPTGPGHIKALTPGYALYYPTEVMQKKVPTSATDIFMLAKTFVTLLGGDPLTNRMPSEVPRHIRELLDECLVEDPMGRPTDAWMVHDRFDDILTRLVGKPVYRPFRMPARAPTGA